MIKNYVVSKFENSWQFKYSFYRLYLFTNTYISEYICLVYIYINRYNLWAGPRAKHAFWLSNFHLRFFYHLLAVLQLLFTLLCPTSWISQSGVSMGNGEQRLYLDESHCETGEWKWLLKCKPSVTVYDLPSLFSALHKSQFGRSSSGSLLVSSARSRCR